MEGKLNGILFGSVPCLAAFSVEPVAEFPIGCAESVVVSGVVVRAREGYVTPIMTSVYGFVDVGSFGGGGRHREKEKEKVKERKYERKRRKKRFNFE